MTRIVLCDRHQAEPSRGLPSASPSLTEPTLHPHPVGLTALPVVFGGSAGVTTHAEALFLLSFSLRLIFSPSSQALSQARFSISFLRSPSVPFLSSIASQPASSSSSTSLRGASPSTCSKGKRKTRNYCSSTSRPFFHNFFLSLSIPLRVHPLSGHPGIKT